MNKFLIYLAFAAAALLLVGCASEEEPVPEGTGMAAVHGSVVIDGEPVNAAAILLTPGGGVKITGSDGLYDFTGLVPGTYEMKVFKEGCQSLNKSIELVADRDEELVFTLAKSVGGLSVNKSYVDMGSNESNNVAGFTVKNDGTADISWEITNAARWITKIEPASGSSPAGGATAVSFTIDRSRLSSTTTDNYATLLVRSTTQGDGSVAELLVTVFSTGDGTNTANDNSDIDYVMVGDLYVQTKDISDKTIDWESAKLLCENSTVGDFNDWRLPTIEELATIYNNKRAIGGFAESEDDAIYYWSSSQSGNNASTLNFSTGQQRLFVKSSNCRVRAVRKNAELKVPTVVTLPVTDITETTAVLHGSIESEGNPTYTERGFVYSATFKNPTVETDEKIIVGGVGKGEFFTNIQSLILGTNYNVRAFATNSEGTAYGETVSFRPENPDYVILEDVGIMVQKYDLGYNEWYPAYMLCENLVLGGFSDWRLPTLEELITIYNLRDYIGNFKTATYWSSDIKDEYAYSDGTVYSTYYYGVDFSDGSIRFGIYSDDDLYNNNRKYNVRAVRSLP